MAHSVAFFNVTNQTEILPSDGIQRRVYGIGGLTDCSERSIETIDSAIEESPTVLLHTSFILV